MAKHNPNNERIKRNYFTFLKEAKRHSEATIDAVAEALARFERDTKYRDFKVFHIAQAVAFKNHLAEQISPSTGSRLSKATINATLAHLKRFFQWLAWQPGFKSHLDYSDGEYFNLSKKEARVATARRERQPPTMEQILHAISRMPVRTVIEKRDRAVVAFTLLSGTRDGAMASLKLKHIDLEAGSVYFDAREVKTKFSKTFTTYFFPVGDEIRAIVDDWVTYLREVELWGNDDPLFPATDVGLGGDRRFQAIGLKRMHWSTAEPIRKIFRKAFKEAGLPYFNPHSFRATLGTRGQTICQTPEQFKAWSQNLGHEDVLTTFLSYGQVATTRQREILRDLSDPSTRTLPVDVEKLADAVARRINGGSL